MKQEIKERVENIRRGEVPEGYRKTKVGIIPVDWEVKKIEDVSPLQRGFDLTSNELKSGDYPVVYSNGIVNYHCSYKVKGPGVVTGRSGTIGKVTFVEEDYWPHNTSLWVTNFKGNDPKFIYYLYLQIKLERFGAGSGVPTLNRNDVHSFKIPLPLLLEQPKIAEILSTWDKAIELKEKLIKEKKEFKRGLMQKLLTGEIRFPEFTDDWNEIPFNQIFNFEGGFTASRNDLGNKGIAYLHYGDIHKSNKNFIDVKKELTNIPKINLDIDKVPTKNLLKDGYIVFADASEDYEGIGKSITIFNPEEIPFINGLHTIVGIPKNGTLNKNYSRFFLLEQSIRKQMMFYAQGISVFGISQVYLKLIVAHLPFEPEQEKIAEILSTCEKAIELKEKELNQLKEQKRGLMQLLFTGIVRVEVD